MTRDFISDVVKEERSKKEKEGERGMESSEVFAARRPQRVVYESRENSWGGWMGFSDTFPGC